MDNEPKTIWTFEFMAMVLSSAMAFSAVAVFYGLGAYLGRLGLDPAWRGPLLAAEPLAALAMRPIVSPLLTSRNALGVIRTAMLANGAALLLYQLAASVTAMLAVRVIHGAAFVTLVSAITTLLVRFVPPGQSARAFGVFTLSSLVPMAVMPFLAEKVLAWLGPGGGQEYRLYALTATMFLPALAMLVPLGRRLRAVAPGHRAERPTLAQIRQNLASPGIGALLGAGLCVYTVTSLVFYNIKDFALMIGVANPGAFFTVSTGATIAARVLGSRHFDRLPRVPALAGSFVALAAIMAAMSQAGSETAFFALAALYGLGFGAALPLLNATMFDRSEPAFRGLNMNISLSMMDLGYVLGPLAGGAALSAGIGFPGLLVLGGGCALVAALLTSLLGRTRARAVAPEGR